MTDQKIRVAVLYGGRSGEHEVSLRSAASVVRNLDRSRFEVVPIGIDKQGRWLLNDAQQLALGTTADGLPLQTPRAQLLPSPCQLTATQTDATMLSKPLSGKLFDVVFPVLHGVLCEDGTLQGLLELMDAPYVGAGVLSSAVGMDKDVSKRLVAAAGLAVPDYLTIKKGSWQANANSFLQEVSQKLVYPMFVKPINTGSSVGVHKVKNTQELIAAINDAFLYDVKVIVEQGMNIREIELSVLENSDNSAAPLVSIPGEITPQGEHEFYSYAAKYLDADGAALRIPALLDDEQIRHAQQFAGQIFEVLGCEGMARVDLFLEKETGKFIFNEVNTLPGFTQISMYPKLWEASGLSYQDLLSRLIDLALARHERKQALKREWAIADR